MNIFGFRKQESKEDREFQERLALLSDQMRVIVCFLDAALDNPDRWEIQQYTLKHTATRLEVWTSNHESGFEIYKPHTVRIPDPIIVRRLWGKVVKILARTEEQRRREKRAAYEKQLNETVECIMRLKNESEQDAGQTVYPK